MASGAPKEYHGTFVGAAADYEMDTCPFAPRSVEFWATGGVWGIKIADLQGMDGANYLSSTAADVGVTLTSDGFDVANGADVNVSGETVYFVCRD